MRQRPRRVTLREVAREAGVSTGTVSHALNDSPLIRVETRARVLEAVRRLDYVPDRNASRLLHGRSECIGIAFDSNVASTMTGATFYAMVVRGITGMSEEQGYSLRFVRLDEATTRPIRQRPLRAGDVDGIIALNWISPVLMQRLCSVGVPIVALDASGGYPNLPSVDNDDRGGVALGVDYLIGLGHRRIALLNETLEHPFGREALAGYLEAYERNDLTVEPRLLVRSEWGMAGAHRAMASLLQHSSSVPSAVFAVSDEMAVGAMQALREAGLHVPDDLSVVGMDDIPLAADVRPALTSVRIDMEALGRAAVDLLVQIIAERHAGPSRVTLPTRLVERDSAAPLSGPRYDHALAEASYR